MPQVTVYIRQEDLEKWQQIQKKSEFLHEALSTGLRAWKQVENVGDLPPRIKTKQDAEKAVKPETVTKGLCEHGQLKGQCLVPKCKFSRYK